MLYVNGRKLVDGRRRIALSAGEATLGNGRRVELPVTWQLDDPMPEGYRPFLHFVDAEGEIVFQGSHDPTPLANGRTGKVDVRAVAWLPEGIAADAEFELRMGFYRPDGGARLGLVGPGDGEGRIAIGTLRIEAQAEGPTAVEFVAREPQADPFLARCNLESKPIDFGPVTTAGACRLSPDGDALMVTPLPGVKGPAPTVRIDWAKLPWELPEPTHVEAVDEAGEVSSRKAVQRDGEQIVIECESGVFAHRLGVRSGRRADGR